MKPIFYFLFFLCSLSAVSQTTSQLPIASFSIETTRCVGDTIAFTDLSSNNPNAWTWTVPGGITSNVFAMNPTFVFNASGNYTAKLKCSNASGSSTYSLTFFVNPNPIVTVVSSRTSICRHETVTVSASGASTYLWSNNQTGPTLTLMPLYSTTYKAIGTDTLGCRSTASLTVKVSICEFSGLSETSERLNFSIAPNPGTGKFTVNLVGIQNINYEVINSNGKIILKGEQETGQNIHLNLDNYENGIYFLKINSNGKSGISKIIKY